MVLHTEPRHNCLVVRVVVTLARIRQATDASDILGISNWLRAQSHTRVKDNEAFFKADKLRFKAPGRSMITSLTIVSMDAVKRLRPVGLNGAEDRDEYSVVCPSWD